MQGRRIELQERKRLPDQHFVRRELPSPESFPGWTQVEVPVAPLHQLAAIALVEGLELVEHIAR
jgi:hypothetical protein